MRAIQDVPVEGSTYMAIWFERNGVTMQTAVDANAGAVKAEIDRQDRKGWKLANEVMRVYRMVKPLTREDIEASVRRKRGKRTLLTVQADRVFADDLNVNDYWQVDWTETAKILEELFTIMERP